MRETLRLGSCRLPSPEGDLLVVFDDRACVHGLDWQDHADRLQRLLQRRNGAGAASPLPPPAEVPTGIRAALQAYFDGQHDALDALELETGGTAFQQQVWGALREIPAGQTLSYSALARRIGRPLAARATGLAVGANPVSLAIPCHRIIGRDGSLTGYAGGLERKRWLLSHESAAFSLRAEPEPRPHP